ncbi:hypothetical protein MKX01_004762, partial [Papaver californicum]
KRIIESHTYFVPGKNFLVQKYSYPTDSCSQEEDKWFLKFPWYKNRELFITGESYAGHYVPKLANLMMQFNKKENMFNLKGYYCSLSSVCSRVMSQVSRETSKFVDKYDVTLDVCMYSVLSPSKIISPQTVNYLNRRDVKKALHVRLVGVRRWEVCSNILDYDLLNIEIPKISTVGSLVKAGIPILIYSGDQDSVIPLTGSRKLNHGLAKRLRLETSTVHGCWMDSSYGNVLSFATIRGASHEAPFSQPERSLVLFKAFSEGRPLPEVLF